MAYKKITEATDLKGKKVLLRADYNVPIKNGKVVDDFRIRKSLPTLEFLKNAGAKIIIVSHIESEGDTLRPIYEFLREHVELSFCEDCLENPAVINDMKDGDIVLCENLRLYNGEKINDKEFGANLAKLADIFVNDAFSVSHRSHASICRITEHLPGYAGPLFDKEVVELSASFNPPHPFLFILGGAKFDTKIPLITKFAAIADQVFVGGALAHNFWKEEGKPLGESLVSDGEYGLTELYAKGNIALPVDTVVFRDGAKTVIALGDIRADESMFDDGPKSLELLKEEVNKAAFILWNGPLGNYENGYTEGTLDLAKIVSESKARTVVGGGDTLAAIATLNIEDKFGFVSTAGGAMLDFLANGTLPGIEALKKSK